jgi:hypothetical protein
MQTDIFDFSLSSGALADLCSFLFGCIQNPLVLIALFRRNASAVRDTVLTRRFRRDIQQISDAQEMFSPRSSGGREKDMYFMSQDRAEGCVRKGQENLELIQPRLDRHGVPRAPCWPSLSKRNCYISSVCH